MFQQLKNLFSSTGREEALQKQLDALRPHLPVPVFWLFGKTQTGKTTIIKFLTGAEQAEIGHGYKPCTRFSREYNFPTDETPLATFLDTRGLDEPGYDATEDLTAFNSRTHVVVVTAKVMDHAQENVLKSLQTIRQAQPNRPVILVLTCLHEAYPQQQHPEPYPFTNSGEPAATDRPLPEELTRSIAEHRRRFEGLVDQVVAVDLTPADEGFKDPDYGGEHLRTVLFDALPAAMAQTMRTLGEATRGLQDLYARQALPHIIGYSTLAATAGAVPVPILDAVLLSGVQSRMVYHLAELYGQPLSAKRFWEIVSTLGTGQVLRQAGRGLIKLIPGIGTILGSVAGGAMAGASTFALGKAFCYYYQSVHKGHVPKPEDLKRYYHEQFTEAQRAWTKIMKKTAESEQPAPKSE